ncbi:MAG: hypothetical protein M3N32_05810 [Actinomycetota bacterium]|nr:hypothetical protein [Actinomycetota bacterium]
MQRTYVLGGTRVGIRTTSRPFGGWLDAALGAYATEGWDGADYSLVVADGAVSDERRRRDFSVLYKGTRPVMRTLDLPTLGRALLSELSAILVAERRDLILLALPVLAGARGALLASPRIAGAVGELGRRAERAGLGLPATTVAAIDPESGHVAPLPPLPETPTGSWRILDALGSPRMAGGPRLVTEPVMIDAVCLSERGAGATARPRSRVATLETLVAKTLNFGFVAGAGLDGLARLTERARCYELGSTDARRTMVALTSILESGPA